MPTLASQRQEKAVERAIKTISETIRSTRRKMWFYGLSKNWEPWSKASSVSQNWQLTFREPSHLSVLQPAFLASSGALFASLAPLEKQRTSHLTSPELTVALIPYLTLKIVASVAVYFKMETDLCGTIYLCLFNYQFICLSAELMKILLLLNELLRGILRPLNGGSKQSHITKQVVK